MRVSLKFILDRWLEKPRRLWKHLHIFSFNTCLSVSLDRFDISMYTTNSFAALSTNTLKISQKRPWS